MFRSEKLDTQEIPHLIIEIKSEYLLFSVTMSPLINSKNGTFNFVQTVQKIMTKIYRITNATITYKTRKIELYTNEYTRRCLHL
jgi:hypothetical protein